MDFNFFNDLSPQLATFLLAMLPVTELRASIPIALHTFSLPVWEAFTYSIIGDFIPAIFLVYFLGPVYRYVSKYWKWVRKIFDWVFKRTRNRFNHKYVLWGKIALMFFVSIPLPGTGAWTGAIAAWLFGIDKKQSLIYIFFGVIIAGILTTLISLGIFNLFNISL